MIERRKEDVKFFLGNVDNVGGSFFTKLFKIKLGHGAKGFEGRLWGRWGWGLDNIGTGVDGAGLKGVQVNKGNARVSNQGSVDRGLGGGKERKTRNNELGAGHNSG